MKIAVIGSGISGLSAAHFLSKKYEVDLFEKNDHFGGHSYTTEVFSNDTSEKISVDLGFIVFNKINYPNLINLFCVFLIKNEHHLAQKFLNLLQQSSYKLFMLQNLYIYPLMGKNKKGFYLHKRYLL